MHIPENYLSPETCLVMGAAMLPVWYTAVRQVRKNLSKDKLPLLGIGAALSFLGMMFNVPLPGGTTGHAVGGTLIAVIFGPWAACLGVTAALLIQALFFGDGGILALGANCFNMAFALPFTGYFLYKQLSKRMAKPLAAALASYVGINVAALCAAIEFGIQPLLYVNEAGQALYCPYPLSISIPAMMFGHLTLFGLAEAVFTGAIFSYLAKTAPSLLAKAEEVQQSASRAAYGLVAALIVLTPLGLLAEGTAWGEWGTEEMAELTEDGAPLGYTPSGMEDGFSFESMFPDYVVSGLPEVAGYILSALIGTALIVLLFRIGSSLVKSSPDYDAHRQGA